MKLSMQEHGDYVRQELAKGESYRKIAEALGCSKDTVSIFAKVNFPELRRVPVADQPPPPEVVLRETTSLNILIIDIETRPNLAYVWGVWDQNIQPRQLVDEKEVISFAAKWLDNPDGPYSEVMFYSSFHHGKDAMVKAAWELLDAADAVITYNGKKFDIPHLNLEFVRSHMTPPSPFRQIDLLNTIRREFRFTHNKLDHVADKLLNERKVEHEGFDLWVKCMAGDPDAWDRMKQYNIGDVLLTERLYHRILPYITQHPSYAAFTGGKCCPNCGSEKLKNSGRQYTKTRAYIRYVCDACGKYCRDTHTYRTADVTETSSW